MTASGGDLRDAVRKVLVFWSIYSRPLTAAEIFSFLPDAGFGAGEVDYGEFCLQLKEFDFVEEFDGFFVLKGADSASFLVEERREISDVLWLRVRRFCSFLRIFPFVRMVAVGNTLAFGVVDEESDIDLFIVAGRRHIFFVRTLVTFYFQVLGLRRHGTCVSRRFCLSFYVAEDSLNLENVCLANDIYLYFWILTLQPLFGIECYKRFLQSNIWLKDFRGSDVFFQLNHLFEFGFLLRSIQRFFEVVCQVFLAWWLEPVLRFWQVRRARRKTAYVSAGEKFVVLSDEMLKFHDKDARAEVRGRFEDALKAVNSTSVL